MSEYDVIPVRIMDNLNRYVKYGHSSGFLDAVLSNNLVDTFGRADAEHVKVLREIVMYMYNKMPYDCWGSKEKVAAWKKMKCNEMEKSYNDKIAQKE